MTYLRYLNYYLIPKLLGILIPKAWRPGLPAWRLAGHRNFAIWFLLEIPPEGTSFSDEILRTNTEHLKTTQPLLFRGFDVRRRSPQGDLEQEAHRKHPVLLSVFKNSCLFLRPRLWQFEI